jgi:hypothetical protein
MSQDTTGLWCQVHPSEIDRASGRRIVRRASFTACWVRGLSETLSSGPAFHPKSFMRAQSRLVRSVSRDADCSCGLDCNAARKR